MFLLKPVNNQSVGGFMMPYAPLLCSTIPPRTTYKTGCPYCSNHRVGYGNSLADTYPKVAAEWNQEMNGNLTPDDVLQGEVRV